ncbi:hypothetical protein E2C01_040882 [Portunus trituberculatus]|uniref:Reverse transcriptase zinc-binding domain-containing protein n=1 Tax=Portunus trituberculatus TaxID=210409 RepID=A0A5B7FNW5_PORTR|nr:hypothetical protein [Portunus trituberculatus]
MLVVQWIHACFEVREVSKRTGSNPVHGPSVVSQSGEGTQATAAIARRLRMGHTTLSAHLHCLRLSHDLFCPWCRTSSETTEHFLLHCPHFHSHRTALHFRSPSCPSQHSTCPPSWRSQASTAPGNLLSFALPVPS